MLGSLRAFEQSIKSALIVLIVSICSKVNKIKEGQGNEMKNGKERRKKDETFVNMQIASMFNNKLDKCQN